MRVIPGLYELRIRLRRPATITVGALGRVRFPAGWYVYTGSARNGRAFLAALWTRCLSIRTVCSIDGRGDTWKSRCQGVGLSSTVA